MKSALEKGRTEFVELLLEHGVNMGNFLNLDRLEALYSVVSIEKFVCFPSFYLSLLHEKRKYSLAY